jgi:uroporphyrinogen decarboxylase
MDLGGRIAGIRHEAYATLVGRLGLDCPIEGIKICPFLTAQEPDVHVLEALGTDFYWLNVRGPEYVVAKTIDSENYVNEWGVTVRRVENYAQRVSHPLARTDLAALDAFEWPDVRGEWRYQGVHDYAEHLYRRTDYALALNPLSGGLFETAQHLRGMETFFVDLLEDKEFAHALLDKILDVQMAMTARYLEEVGDWVSVVALSDDYASAKSLLISPALFDEFFKPRYSRFTAMIKAKAEGRAKILLHSCGAVFHLIDRFIEMGIDVLNPIQPTAQGMDSQRLKDTFGHRLCFHGGIDSQYTLANGSTEDIRRCVAESIDILGAEGGYILAPSHHIQFSVPAENIVALYEAGRTHAAKPQHFTYITKS